jgi:hypothetical protein
MDGGRRRRAREWWRGALTAALLLVLPSALRAQNSACDPGDREIRALKFRGNHAFRGSELALRVATTPSSFARRTFRMFGKRRCLDSDELRLDVGRLRLFYNRHGYYSAAVDTSVVANSDSTVKVTFLITEGPPVLVDTLRITGLDSVTAPIASTNELDLRPGVVFDRTRLQGAIDSIKARLRDNGFPRADVAAAYSVYDTVGHRARVSLEVIPGQRAAVGRIRVFNEPLPGAPRRLGDSTVLRLLSVSSGDAYSEHDLADAQRELYQSDLFRHVEVRLAPDSAQPKTDSSHVTLDVVLRENYVRQVDTEVGWAVLDCFKGRAVLVDKNFLGEARRLELTAQVSKIGHAENTRFANGNLCSDNMDQDPFSSRSELLREQHLPAADAVRAARLAGDLGVQRAARRVSGVPAHDGGRWRGVAHARPAPRAAAAPGVLAGVRTNGCAAGAPVRGIQPMRQRIARAPHGEQPAPRGRERARRPAAGRQPGEPALGNGAAARHARLVEGDRLRRRPAVHQGARRRVVLSTGDAGDHLRGAAAHRERARPQLLVRRQRGIRPSRGAAVRRRRDERARLPAERAGRPDLHRRGRAGRRRGRGNTCSSRIRRASSAASSRSAATR